MIVHWAVKQTTHVISCFVLLFFFAACMGTVHTVYTQTLAGTLFATVPSVFVETFSSLYCKHFGSVISVLSENRKYLVLRV